jgi:predicted TIM-barrel fold metal-dependent hydrolase
MGLGLLAVAACGPPYKPGEARHVIDFHTHIAAGGSERAAALAMASGVDVMVNLVGRPAGPILDAYLQEAASATARNPGFTMLVFSGLDWALADDPAFGEVAASNLEQAVAKGAAGLKVFKSLGLGVRTANGKLLTVDDPRLDPVWEMAGKLRIPVAIHTGDPLAFFRPVTPQNERYEELEAHPSWSFCGDEFPSLAELLRARDRMVKKHPKTTFVAVHLGGFPENIPSVAASMRVLPNLYIDVAARIPEIGRGDTARLHDFFEEFQDRILFGTDLEVDRRHLVLGSGGPKDNPNNADVRRYYDVHWRFFETRDRGFEHMTPVQGRWTVSGIGLSRKVLDKIYHDNARRLLRLK